MSKSMQSVLYDLLCAGAANMRFDVRQSFSFQAGPWWKIGDRVKDDLFLAYIVSGKGRYITDSASYDMQPGKVFFIGNGVRHSAETDASQPPVLLTIHFSCVGTDGAQQPLTQPVFLPVQLDAGGPAQDAFRRVYELRQQTSPWSSALRHAGVLEILDLLYRALSGSFTPKAQIPRGLQVAADQLRAGAHHNVSIRDLAREAGYSEKYFSALFRRTYGVSPKQFHTRLRMQAAAYYLQETDMPVAAAARALGFADAFSFSKQFRRHFGVSPRNMRQGRG